MSNDRKVNPVNIAAVAVNAWIEDVVEAHSGIQRELEKMLRESNRENRARSMDIILDSLRKIRAASPSPRTITAWVGAPSGSPLN